MNESELDTLANSLTVATKGTPCCGGCGEKNAAAAESLPDLHTLEAQLAEVAQMSEAPVDELIFAGLDTELSFADELGLAGLDEAALPSLADLLAIVEQRPGLKITFSY